jgi:ADP-heptose:LPS heptosyltransferase
MDVRNIAVVQLDGPVELLASSSAILGLKKTYPGSEVTLINSAKTSELSSFIPADRYLIADDLCGKIPSLDLSAVEDIDLLVNLGRSEHSCSIASQISAKKKLGPYWNEEKKVCLDDGWTRFYEAMSRSNEPSAIHLIEMLSSIAGVQWANADHTLNISDEVLDAARAHLKSHEHIKVAILPDSTPNEAIRHAIRTLHECGFQIHFYIIGTLKERAAAHEILDGLADAAVCCTNLTGKTTLAELISLFYLCDMAISGQGLGAIAACGFGTLNLCCLRENENSYPLVPYGMGHLVFQTENGFSDYSALGDLFAETIAYAVTKNNGNTPERVQWQEFFDLRIEEYIGKLRTHISTLVNIEHNKVTKAEPVLHPLLFSGFTSNDVLRNFHRRSWENILNEIEISHSDYEPIAHETIADLNGLTSSIDALVRATSFGIRYANQIRDCVINGNLSAAQDSGQKLQDVDDLIRRLAESDPRLQSIVNYFFINQDQIFDIDPLSVSKQILLCYTLLSHQGILLLGFYRNLLGRVTTQGTIKNAEAEING